MSRAEQSTGEAIEGELPSPIAPPSGCRFRTRCPRANKVCTDEEPQIRALAENHYVACHFPLISTAETDGSGPAVADSDNDLSPV